MNDISFPHWLPNSDNLLSTLRLFTNDSFIFPIFQIFFWLIVILAYLKDKQFVGRIKRRLFGPSSLEVRPSVKRGEQSWNAFILAYGVTSVIFVEVINSTSALTKHKTMFMLSNLGALLYLMFFNAWFRNKMLSFINRARTLEE